MSHQHMIRLSSSMAGRRSHRRIDRHRQLEYELQFTGTMQKWLIKIRLHNELATRGCWNCRDNWVNSLTSWNVPWLFFSLCWLSQCSPLLTATRSDKTCMHIIRFYETLISNNTNKFNLVGLSLFDASGVCNIFLLTELVLDTFGRSPFSTH